jgi:hypothetical protein
MKSPLKSKVYRLLSAAALVGISALLGFNCSQFATNLAPSMNSAASAVDENPSLPVALLSSEQILKAMISATGTEGLGDMTASEDSLIGTTYNERTGSLPSGQDVSLATGPMLISVTNLASAVCAKAVDRDRTGSDRLFFNEMDFTKGLSAQSSDAVSMGFSRLARNAWRRDADSVEVESIIKFAQEFAQGADTNDPAQTRMLAISTCTAVLSSADALTY